VKGSPVLRGLGLAAALAVFIADQASKAWIVDGLRLPERISVAVLPFLNFTWVENRGITFGMFGGFGALGPILLTVVALAVVAALGVWLWRAERALPAAALGAIAGGAVGNVLDRLRLGYVVDFLHAHAAGYSWYVFNLADAAIVCGVAALVLDGMRSRPEGDKRNERLADPPGGR
jgi:lipoprotein signal peptidase